MTMSVKRLSIAWMLVLALVALLAPGFAQKEVLSAQRPARSREVADIAQAIRVMNGTWRLRKRYDPKTNTIAKVTGTTTIDLKPFSSTSARMGSRALGTIVSRESGIYDTKCESCAPKEFLGKPFTLESNGTWAVSLVPSTDRRLSKLSLNSDEFVVSVTGALRVVGDWRIFQKGVNSQTTTFIRVGRRGRNAAMISPTTLAGSTERATTVAMPTTNEGELIDDLALLAACCGAESLTLGEDVMTIKYMSGLEDEWVRVR